ncbi:MAG: sulfatase-like hydrolase/transferase [Pseudomonadota bacterium]
MTDPAPLIPDKPPNVLLLFSDQHRAQAMSCAGDPNVETTHMDRLAAEGLRCSAAYTNAPLCAPARGCVHTGQHPNAHGVITNHYPLIPSAPQLAQVFHANSYHTAHLGKWHLCGGDVGQHFCSPFFRPGWDEWIGWESAHAYGGDGHYWDTRYGQGARYNVHHTHSYQSDWLADRFLAWLDTAPVDRPWLKVVSFEAPHGPCQVPEAYAAEYRNRKLRHRPNYSPDHPRADDPEHALPGYYAMIKNLDDNIGRILSGVESAGLLEDTLIVYFSDHGDLMGSHGRNGKSRPEEESIRIPWLMRYPVTLPQGAVHEGLISLVDLMPTLLGLLGFDIPNSVQGIDRSPALCGTANLPVYGADRLDEAIYIQQNGVGYIQTAPHTHWRALRIGPWSLATSHHTGPNHLHHLEEDPYQQHNLFHDALSAAIRDELFELMRTKAAQIGDTFFSTAPSLTPA